MRYEGVVADRQQMATTWENQLSLLIELINDINEILKLIKNNQKFFIHIKPLFTYIHKYNSEIFHLLKENFD